MSINYERMSDILRVLAHPARLRIIRGLLANECNVGQIRQKLSIPQSSVSRHLSVLKSHRILKSRKEGRKTCYRVVDPRVIEIIQIFQGK
jgi:DNA-binding transcriptional ArsR family regulator